jgi:hypothetical protein
MKWPYGIWTMTTICTTSKCRYAERNRNDGMISYVLVRVLKYVKIIYFTNLPFLHTCAYILYTFILYSPPQNGIELTMTKYRQSWEAKADDLEKLEERADDEYEEEEVNDREAEVKGYSDQLALVKTRVMKETTMEAEAEAVIEKTRNKVAAAAAQSPMVQQVINSPVPVLKPEVTPLLLLLLLLLLLILFFPNIIVHLKSRIIKCQLRLFISLQSIVS